MNAFIYRIFILLLNAFIYCILQTFTILNRKKITFCHKPVKCLIIEVPKKKKKNGAGLADLRNALY